MITQRACDDHEEGEPALIDGVLSGRIGLEFLLISETETICRCLVQVSSTLFMKGRLAQDRFDELLIRWYRHATLKLQAKS